MPANVLLQLQELLLQAVLLSQPLPGQSRPVRFPDLGFVLKQPVIYVAGENLGGTIQLKDLPMPLRTLSLDALQKLAREQGDVVYLYFQPADRKGDDVRLTLEARIVAQDPNKRSLGLSNIHVRFVKVAKAWKVVEEPVYSAS